MAAAAEVGAACGSQAALRAHCFLFALKEEITVVSLSFFGPGNSDLAPTFLCSLIFFFYFETQCKLSAVLRIKPSINETVRALCC